MIEINLVPDVKRELIKAQRVRSTVITGSIFVGVISIAIVVLLALYVFTVQTVRSGLADQAIDSGNTQFTKAISITDLSKTLTIQNQLTKISALNSSKKIDSRIFDLLKVINPPTPNNIDVSSVTIDSNSGLITIEGQAANSYAAAEVYQKTIEGAKLKYKDADNKQQELTIASNILTSNISYAENSSGVKVLRFTISFAYAEELFSPTSKNTSISVVNQENATDSYLGVPTSIFVSPAKPLTGDQ